jgi:DNA polymerase III alpha subunit
VKIVFGACSWYSRAEGCLSPRSLMAQARALGVERVTVIEHQDGAAFPEWIDASAAEGVPIDLGQWVALRYDDTAPPMACALIARDDAALAALYQTMGGLTQEGVVEIRGKSLPESLWILAMEHGLSENLMLHQPGENTKWLTAARATGATVRLAAAPTPAGRYRIKLIRDHLGAEAPQVLPYAAQAYFNSKDEFLRSVAALAASTGIKTRARAAAGLITGWEHWSSDAFWSAQDIAGWNTSATGLHPETWLKSNVEHLVDYGSGGENPQVILEQRCRQQLNQGFPGNATYEKRLQRELDIIAQLGLAAYLLQVADLSEKLRDQIKTLWVRGSAAASLVVYLLGVSQIDPVAQKLLPERFISPSRVGLPDIDLDVPASLAGEARAIAMTVLPDACRLRVFTFWSPHDALQRAVEKYLPQENKGGSAKRLGEIAEALEIRSGAWPATWAEMEALPNYSKYKDHAREMSLAKALTGFPHNSKLHPSGIGTGTVWSKGLIPPAWAIDTDGKPLRVPAFSAPDAERFGMLKYDLLPNTTLDVLNELTRDQANRDFTKSPFSLGMDEAVVRKAMTLGLTAGLPQLNEGTARRLLSQYTPDTFEGLVQFNALIRLVGSDVDTVARYAANSPVAGDLAPYVTPTRGVFIFQEQIMRVAYHLGGLDWSQADELRAAIAKGIPEKMDSARKSFVSGYQKKTAKPAHEAQKIFEAMTHGGRYVFNRAHAVAYAHLISWCLFFKATEPARFFLTQWQQMQSMRSKVRGDKSGLLRQLVFDARLFGATFAAQTDLVKLSTTSANEAGRIFMGLDSVALIPPAARQSLADASAKGPEAFQQELRKDAQIDLAVKACGFLGPDIARDAGSTEFNLAQKQVAIWGFALDEQLPGLPVRPGIYNPFKLRRHNAMEGEIYTVAGYLHPWNKTENTLTTEIHLSFLIGEGPLRIIVNAVDETSIRYHLGNFPLSAPRLCQVKLARENGVWGLYLQTPMEEYVEPLTPASLWITKLGAAASRIHVR